jgi:hypothetical protein
VTGALVVKRDGALPTASAGFNAALDGILSDAARITDGTPDVASSRSM